MVAISIKFRLRKLHCLSSVIVLSSLIFRGAKNQTVDDGDLFPSFATLAQIQAGLPNCPRTQKGYALAQSLRSEQHDQAVMFMGGITEARIVFKHRSFPVRQ